MKVPVSSFSFWQLFVLLIIGIGVLVQLAFSMNQVAYPLFSQVIQEIDKEAVPRSAQLFLGQEFQGYIEFLRGQIPESGKVLLPARDYVSPFAHVGLMQYYLFPREIHNCGVGEVPACLERVAGADPQEFYILSLKKFPPEGFQDNYGELHKYSEDLGVFSPQPVLP